MSSHLVQRTFVKNGYYHVFNRGNNKQLIFRDNEDYDYFTQLFRIYLIPPDTSRSRWILKNYTGEIILISYCLMPNHFHLLIQQKSDRVLSDFVRSIIVNYTKYFNKKYSAVGHVFQGKFKARYIEHDSDLLNVSRYIHHNAKSMLSNFLIYPYSSAQFLQPNFYTPGWLNMQPLFQVLEGFGVSKEKCSDGYVVYLTM